MHPRPSREAGARSAKRARSAAELGGPSQALAVLAAVVLAVLVRLEPLPPVTPIAVPGDGVRKPALEAPLGPPAKLRELRRVQGVAPVMAGAVIDMPEQRPVGARQLEDLSPPGVRSSPAPTL